jgi:hypothetical protein
LDSKKNTDVIPIDNKKQSYTIEVPLDKDLFNYLSFLEKINRIETKEEAILSALRIFKKLNMQDWLPILYRVGHERVIILPKGIINDLISTMDETTIEKISKMIAMNRKTFDVFDHELDLSISSNWGIILNEMQDFGWGSFTLQNSKIIAKQLALPITFLKGYLETLFKVDFKIIQESPESYFLRFSQK